MKQHLSIYKSHIGTKIIGMILIGMGIVFLSNPISLNLKIGFASILIGVFMIFMITKKSIPQQISDGQLEGNINAVEKIIRDLHIDGNAVFLPKTTTLTEERILLPPNNLDIIQVPDIDNDDVFLTGGNGKNLGIAIPPSGLKLLKEIEKEADFENTKMKDMEEKLQKFVGMDITKSLALKQNKSGWILELGKPQFCPKDKNLCRQYPCPTCSAILTAITRSSDGSNHKLWIKDIKHNGKKMTFYLHFIKQRTKQDG